VFGRSRTDEQTTAQTVAEREGAKNRPTPKRRDQEAARKRPLVIADRKEARKVDREERRAKLAQTRKAMETGDEKFLPARDKGPVRRYIRDYVDARRNLAEFLLPIMLVVLALSLVRQQTIFTLSVLLTWASVLAVAADTFMMWRGAKKGIIAKFGADEVPRGGWSYAALRAFQMRRQRMPKPQVARGQYPS
jgi:hypothetical protein